MQMKRKYVKIKKSKRIFADMSLVLQVIANETAKRKAFFNEL